MRMRGEEKRGLVFSDVGRCSALEGHSCLLSILFRAVAPPPKPLVQISDLSSSSSTTTIFNKDRTINIHKECQVM